MEIDQTKLVRVNVKTLRIHMKVRDTFSAALLDSGGDEVGGQEDGYVPDFMPGNHYGDYLMLDIDIDTGQITNWKAPTKEAIQQWINQSSE